MMDYDSESDDPSFRSGLVSPSDSIVSSVAPSLVTDMSYTAELAQGLGNMELESSGDATSEAEEPVSFLPTSRKVAIEKNLLMQIGYFAARATHIPHRKLGKLARRVIIKVSKVLRDDPSSLEVVHDMVARCHRAQAEGLLDRVLQARETPYDKQPVTAHRGSGSGKHMLYADTTENRKKDKEGLGRSKSPMRSDRLQNPSSHSHDRSTSPSSRDKASPLPPPHAPLASSSLNRSAEEARVQSLVRSAATKVQVDNEKQIRRGEGRGVEGEGSTSLVKSEERRRLGKQRSRGGDLMAAAAEEFIPSDESFQSAVSDLDVLDCSADTILAPEEGREEFVGGAGEESSASNSHDSSSRSPDARKHNTSSGSSIEKGVEPVGVVSGFPNKPGFMK